MCAMFAALLIYMILEDFGKLGFKYTLAGEIEYGKEHKEEI